MISIHHCVLYFFFFVLYIYIFFFQAEDGIRDVAVTGVQTCALPISWVVSALHDIENAEAIKYRAVGFVAGVESQHGGVAADRGGDSAQTASAIGVVVERSEERRVGKEGRAGGSREQSEDNVETNRRD